MNNLKAERTLTADLLPCPFCGSLAVVESKEHSTKVRCLDGNCGVSLTRFRFDGSHHDAAFIAWNRRSQSLSTQQPMGEVTDEMAERGARKLAEMDLGWGDPPGVVNATVDVRWMEYAATSRAALTAALHPNQESGE